MQLLRVGALGAEFPVVRDGETTYSLAPVIGDGDLDGAFFARDGIDTVREYLLGGGLEPVDVSGLRTGAPIARPQAVICIGQNYAAHAAESGSVPPSAPIIFFKHPNTVIGPYDDVRIPRTSVQTDWEVELAVVIKRRCRYLDAPEDALAMIAGATISNDVSERQFQTVDSGGQWSKGKTAETFNPLGPVLVPTEDISDLTNLGLRSYVNGEVRQGSNTGDMIFNVCELIHDLSQYLVLEPGDVINTGTPEGVALSGRFPYLRCGDLVRCEIDEIGYQEQRLIGADDAGRIHHS